MEDKETKDENPKVAEVKALRAASMNVKLRGMTKEQRERFDSLLARIYKLEQEIQNDASKKAETELNALEAKIKKLEKA